MTLIQVYYRESKISTNLLRLTLMYRHTVDGADLEVTVQEMMRVGHVHFV